MARTGFVIDVEDELSSIIIQYDKYVNLAETILITDRKKTLNYFSSLIVGFSDFERVIKEYESNILIRCYTYSERLVKEFLFSVLDKDNNDNANVDIFINKYYHPNYVFRPKYKDIKKEVKTFFDHFSFILKANNPYVKRHDELVDSRHTYAHSNSYKFDIYNYPYIFQYLAYLRTEMDLLLSGDKGRFQYTKSQLELEALYKKMKRDSEIKEFRIVRNTARKMLNFPSKHDSIIKVIEPQFDALKDIATFDLRSASKFYNIVKKYMTLVSQPNGNEEEL